MSEEQKDTLKTALVPIEERQVDFMATRLLLLWWQLIKSSYKYMCQFAPFAIIWVCRDPANANASTVTQYWQAN